MNSHTRLVVPVLVVAAPAAAQDGATSLPAVKAEAARYTVDCSHRRLPSQREVGEWTGQHNFSQVYATRERLMAEIGRGCQGSGIEQVRIVLRARPGPHPRQRLAVASR